MSCKRFSPNKNLSFYQRENKVKKKKKSRNAAVPVIKNADVARNSYVLSEAALWELLPLPLTQLTTRAALQAWLVDAATPAFGPHRAATR